jgi:Uma2 family endonuclease
MTKTSTAVLGTIPEGAVVQTELTLDEFLAHNQEEPPYLEYEGKGRVRRKMSPTTDHAAIAGWLSYLFHAYRERTARSLFVYVELRTNAGGLSRVPDVAVYVGQRPRENERKQALVVADLSIEIISPGQTREQQEAKCAWYLRQGGRVAMLIDPPRRELSVWVTSASTHSVGVQARYGTAPGTSTTSPDEPIGELEERLPGLNLSAQAIFSVLNH